MIRPRYAITLARTKLHAKRGTLFASVILSSLLFAAVIIAIITFTGVQKSAVAFIEKANNGKYLVQVEPVIPDGITPGIDPANLTSDNINKIRAYEASYYEQQKAQYKSLGIEYAEPPASDSLLTPDAFAPANKPASLRYRLNFDSPLMAQFEQEIYTKYAQTAVNRITDLRRIAGKYGGDGFYETKSYPISGIPNQLLIQSNKEDFGDAQMKQGDFTSYGYFTNAIHNSQYEFQDEQLLSRYISTTNTNNLKGIPVIVSAQEAASLFGKSKDVGKEPSDDNARAGWLKQVQEKLTNTTYQTCYRNSTEQTMLQKIQQDYADMQDSKNNKDYVKPDLLYAYPTTACGDITVQSDTRTQAEKDADTKQIDVEKRLGTYIAPAHQLVTYQIVGFIEATPYSNSSANINSYLKNLLSYSTLSMDAIIPQQLYDTLPSSLKVDDLAGQKNNQSYAAALESLATRIVAFNTIDQARQFMNDETCPSANTNCKKLFTADPYGSNYLILDQVGKLFEKVMLYSIPVILLLAITIIWFTMSRVMTDNRRETAIYRAMGATRPDIAAIYIAYTIIVAIRIAVTSLIIGLAVAWIINVSYGKQLSNVAVSSFGIQGANTPTFSLFNLSSPYILLILVIIIIVCLIAVTYPLTRNVRRAPIRDMREE